MTAILDKSGLYAKGQHDGKEWFFSLQERQLGDRDPYFYGMITTARVAHRVRVHFGSGMVKITWGTANRISNATKHRVRNDLRAMQKLHMANYFMTRGPV